MISKVVVIGGNHHNTLSVIRSLGQSSRKVDVIIENSTPKDCFVAKSKYIEDVYYVYTDTQIIELLLSKFIVDNEKPVIITCTDSSTAVLDENYEVLVDHFCIFNAQRNGGIAKYIKKQNQVKLAAEIGLITPLSLVYVVGDELPNKVPYPCLIKPLSSIVNSKRADICYNKNNLEEIIKNYPQGCPTLIQQYIKREFEICVDGVSVCGEVFIPGYVYKIRDNINGGSSFFMTKPVEELPKGVVTKLTDMVKRIGYTGLFGVELIFSDNKYFFIEINLRNDATTYSMVKAGVNLPELYVKAIEIGTFLVPCNYHFKKIYSMSEIADLSNSMKMYHISLLHWIRDLKRSQCLYIFDGDDKHPFIKAWCNYIKSQFCKIIRKRGQ